MASFPNPSTQQVASYIPFRTLDGTNPASETPLYDFTSNTQPTATVVGLLITDAVAYVAAKVGVLDATLNASATGIAAKRAAAFVELGNPISTDDVNVGQQLLDESDKELEALLLAIPGVGSTGGIPAPVWSFPNPDQFADLNT